MMVSISIYCQWLQIASTTSVYGTQLLVEHKILRYRAEQGGTTEHYPI